MDLKEAKNILNKKGYRLVEGKMEEPIGYFPVSLKRAIDSVLVKLSAKDRNDKILRKIIMTESNHLARMYFYNGAVSTDMEKWILDCYNEKVNLKESTEEDNEEQANSPAVNILANLHYQICNGGWEQACYNGYVDELDGYGVRNWEKELETEFADSPLLEKIKKVVELIKSAMKQTVMERICPDCNGEGSWEETEEDEDGYEESHTEYCSNCNGDGTVSVSVYDDVNFGSGTANDWADDWDKNYYEQVDSDTIDDITKQSHTHSVVLDAIRGE